MLEAITVVVVVVVDIVVVKGTVHNKFLLAKRCPPLSRGNR